VNLLEAFEDRWDYYRLAYFCLLAHLNLPMWKLIKREDVIGLLDNGHW